MGLDGVELVLATEEQFGIQISDEEASHLVTVNDLFQIVVIKLGTNQSDKCLTASTFYMLRKTLAQYSNVDKKEITTKSQLHDLFPSENRKELWASICKDLNLILPELGRPHWMNSALFLIPFGALLSSTVLATSDIIQNSMAITISASAIVITYLATKLTEPYKKCFPSTIKTVGQLVKFTAGNNFKRLSQGDWSDNDVYEIVLAIISNQLHIPVEKIEPHHSFVEDLGVD